MDFNPDIITFVKDPAGPARHFLLTAGPDSGWRRRPALCGFVPPGPVWWLAHHSSSLGTLCPRCAEALAEVVARAAAGEAQP